MTVHLLWQKQVDGASFLKKAKKIDGTSFLKKTVCVLSDSRNSRWTNSILKNNDMKEKNPKTGFPKTGRRVGAHESDSAVLL